MNLYQLHSNPEQLLWYDEMLTNLPPFALETILLLIDGIAEDVEGNFIGAYIYSSRHSSKVTDSEWKAYKEMISSIALRTKNKELIRIIWREMYDPPTEVWPEAEPYLSGE